MNFFRWRPNLSHVLAMSALLALTLIATVSPGGEQQSGKPLHPTSDGVDSGAARSDQPSSADRTQPADKSLSELLRGLTDQELVAIARGGEPPAKIARIIGKSSARMNEELLAELASRWERQSQPKTVAETANEDVVASEATVNGKVAIAEPPKPIVVKLDSVVVKAVQGSPVNVGVMTLTFVDGHGPILYPDEPLFLASDDQRPHYATFNISYQRPQDKPSWQVNQIRVHFLLRGDGPLQLTLSSAKGPLVDSQQVVAIKDAARHQALLRDWWKEFSVVPENLDIQQKMLKESLLEVLARRMSLPGPWPSIENKDPKASLSLESQFERAIGMLFGIESVKLAMQEDVTLNQSRQHEKANVAIPRQPVMRSIAIPSVPASTWIEPIAMHVPAECFYLRTGNLANYRYFRKFLMGWGGSLDDIVATRSLDAQTRHKIESQLGLNPEDISANGFDKLVSDMALIGCDPLFADGAAVGLLFHARDARGLNDVIKAQRHQAKLRVPGSTEQRVDVAAQSVSLISSDDNRLRSFYAIDGEYHLVTNSRYLLDRFYDAGRGDRSLGALDEFRYARSKTKEQRQTLAFLYLSDPFFQNLISPHYRIEVTRRRQAVQELKQLQLARLVAKAERIDAATINELVETRFLPDGFASRPDGSYPLDEGGQVRDSLRGSPGFFLPVPDVPLQQATQSEVASYHSFVAKYNAVWKRIDPVTVVFSRDGSAANDQQRVSMDIIITPYARQKYSFLQQHLAAASQRRVAPIDGDLLSIDTSIRTSPGQQSHLLYLGLRDDNVPFALKDGKVDLLDQPNVTSYAKSRSYAAISPPSIDMLRLLASVFEQPAPPPVRQERSRPLPPPTLSAVGNALYYFGWALGNLPPKLSEVAKYTRTIATRDGWTVVSTNDVIRQGTLDELREVQIDKPSQVHMRMGSLRGSKVEPYIQTYTYLESRRVSGENSRFLNDFTQWLQVPPQEARDAVEDLLGARVHCPLGGDFVVENTSGHDRWVGTSWSEASLYAVSKTPESWKFPFLDWIRGLDLRFDLDQTTLSAQVDLLVHQPSDPANDGQLSGLQMVDLNAARSERNVAQAAFNRRGSTTTFGPPAGRVVTAATQFPPARPLPSDLLRSSASETTTSQSRGGWILGVRVDNLNHSMRVTYVHPDSPASRIGIRVGDEIRLVEQQLPRTRDHLMTILEAARNKGTAVVQVNRQGATVTFDVPLSPQ